MCTQSKIITMYIESTYSQTKLEPNTFLRFIPMVLQLQVKVLIYSLFINKTCALKTVRQLKI